MVAAVLAGCLGTGADVDDRGAGLAASRHLPEADAMGARELFETTVHPTLVDACGGCHTPADTPAPGWIDNDPLDSYLLLERARFITSPDLSPLLTAGEHEGPALTDAQAAIVTEWLLREAAER